MSSSERDGRKRVHAPSEDWYGPLTVPPGKTRYERAGGLRTRLEAAAAEGVDLHITIDLSELREKTVR